MGSFFRICTSSEISENLAVYILVRYGAVLCDGLEKLYQTFLKVEKKYIQHLNMSVEKQVKMYAESSRRAESIALLFWSKF